MTTTLTVHAMDWKIKDEFDINNKVVIHCWGFSRDSTPYLLRFHDFPAHCYVELPLFIGNRKIFWSGYKVQQVYEKICWKLGENKPFKYFLKHSEKLYYYRGGKKYPMLVLLFNTIKAMYDCSKKLSKPFKVFNLGIVACKVWETKISLVRKLLTLRNMKYCQWFNIEGVKVIGEDKVSKLEHEYVVDRCTMNPIPPEQTSSWVTNPTVFSFDIETYTDRHSALPDPYSSKHVAYMISCVFQRLGDKSSRITDIILYGDCNTTDTANVIMVNSEIEMIDKMVELVNKYDPDILTGYNIFSYDNPYLDTRLKRRLREWNSMSRLINDTTKLTSFSWGSSAYGHNDINLLDMDGRIMIDMYPIIRRDYKLKLYTLKYVSTYFLGHTKLDVTPRQMFETYELHILSKDHSGDIIKEHVITKLRNNVNEEIKLRKLNGTYNKRQQEEILIKKTREVIIFFHLDHYMKNKEDNIIFNIESIPNDLTVKEHSMEEMKKVVDYCVVDSDLVLDLFEKIHCWIALIEMSNVNGVTPVEMFTRGQQLRVLSQVYDESSKHNIVIDERIVPKMDYSGGYVYDPIPGLYNYIPCLDFKSLYPTVMIANNIDFRTFVPPEMMDKIPDNMCHVIEWDEEVTKKKIITEMDEEGNISLKNGNKAVKTTEMIHYKFKFIKQEYLIGILPKLLIRLISERDAVRKIQKEHKKGSIEWIVLETRQLALKISSNSVPGNTPIPCLINNRFEYRTIEELANTKTWKIDNDQNQVSEPLPNIKVWSDVGWTDIKFVIRHPIKKLIRVLTHTGCVDCTSEHSLLRNNGQSVKPTELELGDKLLHVDTPLPIDTPKQPLYRKVSDEDIEKHTLNNTIEKMLFVWGLFFAEGTCGNYGAGSNAKSSWCIYNQDRQLLERACSILNEIEECRFVINDYGTYETTLPNGRTCESYVLYLKPKADKKYGSVKRLATKFRNLFYDRRKNKRVPSEVLNAPFHMRQAFFMGYYAGDGNRNLKVGVVIINRGQIGSAGLYYLMRSLGYKVSISYTDDKNKDDHFRLQCCVKFRNSNPSSIKKMEEAPYPPIIEKTEKDIIRNDVKLEKKVDNTYEYKEIIIKCERLPRQKLLDSLDTVSEKIKNRGNIIEYNTNGKKVTYQCANCKLCFTSSLSNLHANKTPRHNRICKCPVYKRWKPRDFTPYKKEDYVEYIYDIETVSHHFAAGVGNMIVHNSMYGSLGAQKGGKLPLPEAAASITAKSRESTKKMNKYLVSKGHKIVYGDSVTGETPIQIKFHHNEKFVEIQNLYEGVWTKKNGKEYAKLENIYVWSDQGYTTIKYIMRHKTKKRLFRISTNTGIVTVTEDHSLLDPDGNVIKPTDVKIGDKLMTKSIITELKPFPFNQYWAWNLIEEGITTSQLEAAYVYDFFFSKGYCVSIGTKLNEKGETVYVISPNNDLERGIIRKIEDLGYIDDYVYDLETKNHHFAAGVGELVVHNTDSSMPDIGITDPTKAYAMAKEIAEELSKLFPAPMLVEDEEVYHTMLCIKKKMYLCIKMNKDGTPVLDRDKLTVKGVVPARRDNCKYQKDCFIDTAWMVLLRKEMMETYNYIIDMCLKLVQHGVPWEDLVIVKGLGGNYKSKSYCMKVFSDELCKIGKPATPGDRLEYVIVKTSGVEGKQLLGYKMRLPSTYLERLNSDKPEYIDYNYYMEKALMNCIQKQLFQVGYNKELAELEKKYLNSDRSKVLSELRNKGYGIIIDHLMKLDNNKDKIIKYLLNETKLKTTVSKLISYHIKKRGRIVTRVNGEPIKMMVKIIQARQKCMDVIKSLVHISEIPKLKQVKLNIIAPKNSKENWAVRKAKEMKIIQEKQVKEMKISIQEQQ